MQKSGIAHSLLVAAGLLVPTATFAQPAQPPTLFVGATIGVQSHSHTFSTADSFALYDETASLASDQAVTGGTLFNISGGYRVWQNLAVAVAYSWTTDVETAEVTGSIPHPLFFDNPSALAITVEDLERKESAVHIQAMYFLPRFAFLPERLLLAVVAGPSFFKVEQQLVTALEVAFGTQNGTAVVGTESASAVGMNGGLDLSYAATPDFDVNGFIRYSGAQMEVPSVLELKVGGLQLGVGLRVRF